MAKKVKKEALDKENQEAVKEEGVEREEDVGELNDVEKREKEESAPPEETIDSVREEWIEKNNDLNDKYLRLYSDFENFRKRSRKEKSDIIIHANSGVLTDLLPVLDDFERAIANNQDSTDPNSIKEGFELIYNKFHKVLSEKGLKPMQSIGDDFNLDQHEAITNIAVDKKKDKGKVMDVVEKGYYLNDKVLRYAKVVVGQ